MDGSPLLGARPASLVFPSHLKLEELRACIQGKREFKMVEYDSHWIVSYTYPKGDSFPEPDGDATRDRELRVLRECRGLVMARDGVTVLARRYHKFFNINEFAETHMNRCAPLTATNHVVMEKLDGSMVSPWVEQGDQVVWATKMGRNPVADDAGRYASQHSSAHYEALVLHCHHQGEQTVIFEWCSKQRPVVLHYEQDALVCTGLRHKTSGHYATYSAMSEICARFGVPVVKTRQHGCRSVAELVQLIRAEKGLEGCVLRYENGEQVKLKTDWYGNLCRALQQTANPAAERSNERFVWTTVLDVGFDDVRSCISPDERDRLDRFASALRIQMEALLQRLETFVGHAGTMSDRAFADHVRTQGVMFPSGLCFAMKRHLSDPKSRWNALEALIEYMVRTVNKVNGLEEVRALMGGIKWEDFPLVKADPSVSSYSEWH
jgi:RNA ligase